jgi:hypothetical protein
MVEKNVRKVSEIMQKIFVKELVYINEGTSWSHSKFKEPFEALEH